MSDSPKSLSEIIGGGPVKITGVLGKELKSGKEIIEDISRRFSMLMLDNPMLDKKISAIPPERIYSGLCEIQKGYIQSATALFEEAYRSSIPSLSPEEAGEVIREIIRYTLPKDLGEKVLKEFKSISNQQVYILHKPQD